MPNPVPVRFETRQVLCAGEASELPQRFSGSGQVTLANGHVGDQTDKIDVSAVSVPRDLELLTDIGHAIAEHPDLRAAQRDLRTIAFADVSQFRQHHVGITELPIGEKARRQAAQVIDVDGTMSLHGELLSRLGTGVTGRYTAASAGQNPRLEQQHLSRTVSKIPFRPVEDISAGRLACAPSTAMDPASVTRAPTEARDDWKSLGVSWREFSRPAGSA
jgi:hypothetical protein